MKIKQFVWTVIILIGIVVLTRVYQSAIHEISQEYAISTVDQLADDSIYTLLKNENTAIMVASSIYILFLALFLYLIYYVWTPYKREIKKRKKELSRRRKERRKLHKV